VTQPFLDVWCAFPSPENQVDNFTPARSAYRVVFDRFEGKEPHRACARQRFVTV